MAAPIDLIELSDSDDEVTEINQEPAPNFQLLQPIKIKMENTEEPLPEPIEPVTVNNWHTKKLQPLVEDIEVVTVDATLESEENTKSTANQNLTATLDSNETPFLSLFTAEIILNNACEAFMNDPQTDIIMQQIAEERVRVNYLLALYGMPHMIFDLWSDGSKLDYQLGERLKQRKPNASAAKSAAKSTCTQ